MVVFRRLLLPQVNFILLGWFCSNLIIALITIFRAEENRDEWFQVQIAFLGVGIFAGVLGAKMVFLQERYFNVLKSLSRNVVMLWFQILLQNFLLLFFVGILVIAHQLIYEVRLIQGLNIANVISFSISALLFLCICDSNQVVERTQRGLSGKPREMAKQFLATIIGLLSLVVVAGVYMAVSPALGCLLLNLLMVIFWLYGTDEPKKLFSPNMKRRIFLYAAIGFLIVEGSLAFADKKFLKMPRYSIEAKKPWIFSDIEKVKTVEDWIRWQNRLKSLDQVSADQMIQSYDRLNQLCPPQERDYPLYMDCAAETSGLRDYQFVGKPRSEEDVLKLLSASTEYAQIMGLLYARLLPKPLTRDLILAIEYLAEKQNTVQLIAKNTLSKSYSTDYQDGLVIESFKPKAETPEASVKE